MADNSLRTPGAGETIASDDVGGAKYQRVKIAVGADGVATDMQSPADGAAAAGLLPAAGMTFNETTFDRYRGNTSGTALASAARTATTASPTFTNYNARGVIVFLNVTAASGTGGLSVIINAFDPITAQGNKLNPNATAVLTTGFRGYIVYPGSNVVTPDIVQVTPSPLPRSWGITVFHGDASSYTYSVAYALIV